MTSKERAVLRSAANGLETVYEIGRGDLDEALVAGIGQALKARELIKVHVQRGSLYTAREAAETVADALKAEIIQVIGGRFVLYRHNKAVNGYGIR
jgi:RNA-binding protein